MTDARRTIDLLREALHPRAARSYPRVTTEAAGELVRLARRHRVSSLLARRLDQIGSLGALPEDARRALTADALRVRSAQARLARALRAVAAALDGASLPFLLLKGAALAELAYDDPSEREMSDIDLLVPPDRFTEALDTLRAAGLVVPADETVRFWQEVYFNVAVHTPEDEGAHVEIHWSIAQASRHRPDVSGLFERARPAAFGGVAARALAPADLFLHQALHLGYHYHQPRLAWLLDLAHLAAREPVPLDRLMGRARAWGMRTALLLSLAHVEKAFPGALPAELAAAPRSSLRVRLLTRLLGSRDPAALIAGWDRRPVQLGLALLTLDGPGQMAGALRAWFGRFARHGDRAGHRALDPGPRDGG